MALDIIFCANHEYAIMRQASSPPFMKFLHHTHILTNLFYSVVKPMSPFLRSIGITPDYQISYGNFKSHRSAHQLPGVTFFYRSLEMANHRASRTVVALQTVCIPTESAKIKSLRGSDNIIMHHRPSTEFRSSIAGCIETLGNTSPNLNTSSYKADHIPFKVQCLGRKLSKRINPPSQIIGFTPKSVS